MQVYLEDRWWRVSQLVLGNTPESQQLQTAVLGLTRASVARPGLVPCAGLAQSASPVFDPGRGRRGGSFSGEALLEVTREDKQKHTMALDLFVRVPWAKASR